MTSKHFGVVAVTVQKALGRYYNLVPFLGLGLLEVRKSTAEVEGVCRK